MVKLTEETMSSIAEKIKTRIVDVLDAYKPETLGDLRFLFNPFEPFKLYVCIFGNPPLIIVVFINCVNEPKQKVYVSYMNSYWKIYEFWHTMFADFEALLDGGEIKEDDIQNLEMNINYSRKTFDESLKNLLYERKIPPMFNMTSVLEEEMESFLIYGFLTEYEEITAEELADYIFNPFTRIIWRAKLDTSPNHVDTTKQEGKKETAGLETEGTIVVYGAFLFPQYWIGNKYEINIILKEYAGFKGIFGYFDYETKLREVPVRFSFDGFIALETESRREAFELLNRLCFALNLSGYSAYFVKENELFEQRIVPSKMVVAGSKTFMDIPHEFDVSREHRLIISEKKYPWRLDTRSVYIDVSHFIDALAFSATSENIPFEYISLYVNAVTHFKNTNFTEAHVLAWVIIEGLIEDIWAKAIKNVVAPFDTDEATDKFISGTLDHNLQAAKRIRLAIGTGLLPWEIKEPLDRVRKARNDFMHEKKPIKEADVRLCIETAFLLLGKEFSVLNASGIKPLPEASGTKPIFNSP